MEIELNGRYYGKYKRIIRRVSRIDGHAKLAKGKWQVTYSECTRDGILLAERTCSMKAFKQWAVIKVE
jgi:hypothetical protein